MADYRALYALLCGAASDAADELTGLPGAQGARQRLIDALRRAEEMVLSAPEPQPLPGTNLLVWPVPGSMADDGEPQSPAAPAKTPPATTSVPR